MTVNKKISENNENKPLTDEQLSEVSGGDMNGEMVLHTPLVQNMKQVPVQGTVPFNIIEP